MRLLYHGRGIVQCMRGIRAVYVPRKYLRIIIYSVKVPLVYAYYINIVD